MKNFNDKMNYLNRIQKNSLRPAISQNNSCVYKKNVKHDKIQINLLVL